MNKEDFVKINSNLSQEQIELQNEFTNKAVEAEHKKFVNEYKIGQCYLCKKSFKTSE